MSNPVNTEPSKDTVTASTSEQVPTPEGSSSAGRTEDDKLLKETVLLRDTLDLLWNKTLEQRKICDNLEQQNTYLQGYINNLMSSSNVLEK
ncbi:Slo1p KNAG_0G01980 [Huiozyma naganishii CBS 8797]|uniref:Uncharacterized protein n=1 Tax=Huiozyma naganishii (strain ATCC MYA-139 / BCRC 22969 / CBS 8797 / KCTC 17520 / NBRC 10181 / NCYC 3082 / Yp74L-3) TaxID=1071383 RepID=J7R8Q7_HUIN7|nr:hypothetical protein KNAG_0G01980 [Kazachstania naganishii CBS 8797]CCK71255.1 hypothetical protein KNAG_0G01980 [Kazachstania naganishii CBS 8797]